MEYILLYVFISVSLIQLFAAFFEIETLRKITKLFIMPFLLIYFIMLNEGLYLPVLFALIFAFLGDYFLLEPNKPIKFTLGLASFLIGHLCYIPAFISLTKIFHIPVLIVSYIVAAALGFFVIKKLSPKKDMLLPVIAYIVVILSMSVFALQLMLANVLASSHVWSMMIFIGSILFICSDTMLAFFTFHAMPKRGNFFVMLFYITAQAFIIIGLGRMIS
jgi:uncharacterized membrane protein YhhN